MLKAEIADRIRRFVPEFSDAEFRAMVEDMARIHHKYEQRQGSAWMLDESARRGL